MCIRYLHVWLLSSLLSQFVSVLASEKFYFVAMGCEKIKQTGKEFCCSSSVGHWHGNWGAHDVLIVKGKTGDRNWFKQ